MNCKCGKEIPYDPNQYPSEIIRNSITGNEECYDCHHGITPWKTQVYALRRRVLELEDELDTLKSSIKESE